MVAALVTALDVSAESCGAADFDEVHGAGLRGGKSMRLPVALTVETKHIGEFPGGPVL